MSNENNSQGSQCNSSRPWAVYYKQAKNNMEEINASLIKHLENLEFENVCLYKIKNKYVFKIIINFFNLIFLE
jgi:hypothetical protein